MSDPCPCQSHRALALCCGPLLTGDSVAHSAGQFMRSRYSAFVLQQWQYLVDTQHARTRDAHLLEHLQAGAAQTLWLGLRVLSEFGSAQHAQGQVEFIAFYLLAEETSPRVSQLHERSHFIKEDDRWYYLDGAALPAIKIGRNEACVCGSNKKFKHCHGEQR